MGTLILGNDPDPADIPSIPLYRPAAKHELVERYDLQKQCMEMCARGNYHHHQLKHTRMASCVPDKIDSKIIQKTGKS
jgi:hypothetical protein